MGMGRRWDIWKRSIETRLKVCCDQGVAWEQKGGGMENVEANTVRRRVWHESKEVVLPHALPSLSFLLLQGVWL